MVIPGVVVALGVVYWLWDPAGSAWFPRCPFRMLTGFECPGCGSQRAVHQLFHLDIGAALSENMLLVAAIPYLLLGYFFELRKDPGDRMLRWRKRLYGPRAILIVLFIIIAFWVVRNISFFSPYM